MSFPNIGLRCVILFLVLGFEPSLVWAGDQILFEDDIQPVLVRRCGKCHSEKVRKADLDLSSMNGVLRGGESGDSPVGENLDDSLLWTYIDSELMPPANEPPLSPKERKLIQTWLATGANSKGDAHRGEKSLNQHDVLPILLLRCTACHGAQRREGGLDLRTIKTMKRGGKNGPAIIPGDAAASPLIKRIESEACPPQALLLKFFVRRPPPSEVETLRDWIDAGAPEIDLTPEVTTSQIDPLVTAEDRRHWAFQKPKKSQSVDSIDAFIEDKLKQHGLHFSPEADRDTLIRRAFLDLLGLPPTVEQWKKYRHSSEPDWYPAMIEDLLASPHYGERWGRYWLDLAGYADSEGGVSADPVREVSWKYRDYVIRSFNNDKPYDRFLLEQIAGDELVDVERADRITNEMVDNLVATGFLRMGIDQTGSRTMNYVPERLGVIDDAITIVGSGLIGLTMECARCHSHKYDPIPQRDYYRLKAVFQGAFDEYDWLTFKNRKLDFATPKHRERLAAVNPPLLKERKRLTTALKQANSELHLEMLRQHSPTLSESERHDTLKALKIAENTRTLTQKRLVEELRKAQAIAPTQQPVEVRQAQTAVKAIEEQIEKVDRQLVPPATIRALWDRGRPSPTYILRRGEHDRPGPLVGPGVPSVLNNDATPFSIQPPFPEGTPKTGRRLAFAKWLVDPNHPTTARVMVNRIWYHHFGTGLVKSLENFGRQGEPPSHPKLLDWLAVTFIEQGWSIKQMHRLIMNSRTYRQTNLITEDRLKRDPNNRLLSRYAMRRMDAETIRDSLLFVAGKLDETPFGPPDQVTVDHNQEVKVNPTPSGKWRRSIYQLHRRTEMPTMMEVFDYPEMGPNCLSRSVSVVSLQSLILKNNERVRQLAASLASRVHDRLEPEVRTNPDRLIETVYEIALSRPPEPDELQAGRRAFTKMKTAWNGDGRKALETYCHAILNSAAFLYVD